MAGYIPSLPMNIPQVNTQQPSMIPSTPGATPSSPQGMLPSQVTQRSGALGCRKCTGVNGMPQFRDIAPNTWPIWAKGLLVFGVAGALVTTIALATRR